MARRALLTDGEREALIDPESLDNPYVPVSRIRKKIQEELPRDVELLREHHPGLLEDLRDVVCEEPIAASDSSGLQPAEEPPTVGEPDPREHHGPGPTPPTDDLGRPDRQQLSEMLAEVDLPGSGTSLERRRQVLIDLYEVLREEGEMKTGELQEHADLSGTGYSSMDSFWINVVNKPSQNPLEALPGVEAPGHGGSIWRYQDPGNG